MKRTDGEVKLNISEINVKTRLYRIRKKIQKGLGKGGF